MNSLLLVHLQNTTCSPKIRDCFFNFKMRHNYFPAPRLSHFCSQCGFSINRRVPEGDNRERDICDNCGAIHYQNPRMVVGTIPVLEDRILLCKRAIAPRYNTWTLPAGFMELGESTAEGAIRETLEETGIQINLKNLFTVIDVPEVEQLHLFYLADALDEELNLGSECLEARYYKESEIPWDELSFHTVIKTIWRFFEDRRIGMFGIHYYSISCKNNPNQSA